MHTAMLDLHSQRGAATLKYNPVLFALSALTLNHHFFKQEPANMAEAISLVSGILTLIDFGCKVVSGTSSVLESRHGTAPDVHELNLILKEIEMSHRRYREHLKISDLKLPEDDNTLAILAECDQLRQELSKVIATLRIPDEPFSRTLASWQVAVRKLRKSDFLGNLRVRLLELDRYVSRKIELEMSKYV